MATVLPPTVRAEIEYPTTDFKPMAETELHAEVMIETREMVKAWYENEP